VLVRILPQILQHLHLEQAAELTTVFHQQVDGEMMVDLITPEVLVQAVVVLVQWEVMHLPLMLVTVVLD
jgi:hypothetical protein